MSVNHKQAMKGRGASTNQPSRYMECVSEHIDDGWAAEEIEPRHTEIFIDKSRTIITYNQSPDVPFDRSINPYKGCEHGCAYCFARPTHAYLDLSPGLDFETKIFTKPNAAELLIKELSKKNYQPAPIALGINTDAYQPVERKLKVTRQLLEILSDFNHPVAIVTKSALIERDIDLLAPMAEKGLVKIMVSVTSVNKKLCRLMEPRAAAPSRRLKTIEVLSHAGIPVGVLFAPVIPALNDSEMESILSEVSSAGAVTAGYVILRLPHELKQQFQNWLEEHYPLKAKHVMNILRDMRGGKEYVATYGERMKGSGQYAELIAQRFKLAIKKYKLDKADTEFEISLFRVPPTPGDQINLF